MIKRDIDCWLEVHNLQDNEWLQWLYYERHHWIPTYVKNTFWVGMSTTQRSESMMPFLMVMWGRRLH